MLLETLCKIIVLDYKPCKEFASMDNCKFIESIEEKSIEEKGMKGIWDILGTYDPKSKKITIYEKCIREFIEKNEDLLKDLIEEKGKDWVFYALKELVRLHEHAHAIHHIGKIGIRRSKSSRMAFVRLSADLKEPLADLVVYCIVKKVEDDKMLKLFKIVDEKSPEIYKKWRDILDRLKDPIKNSSHFPEFVIMIIKHIRNKGISNINQLIDYISRNEEKIYSDLESCLVAKLL